jgi:hypothetical protein
VEGRRKPAGRSLCAVIDKPLPLFELWRGVLGPAEYAGAYLEQPAGGGEEQVRFSRSHLSADDKRFLVESVLGAEWTGSIDHDLRPRYCTVP